MQEEILIQVLKHILKNPYMGCCMCLRKEVIDKAIPFPNKIPMHDQYLGLVAELLGKQNFMKTFVVV